MVTANYAVDWHWRPPTQIMWSSLYLPLEIEIRADWNASWLSSLENKTKSNYLWKVKITCRCSPSPPHTENHCERCNTRPWGIYVMMPAVPDQYQNQTSTRPWGIYVLMPAVPDLQYHTMMPRRSCSTTPSARVLMSSAEADPLEPTKMLGRGTFT